MLNPDEQQHLKKTWYILAPHLTYPLRNGADLYAAGVAKGISYQANTVLVGAATISHFRAGNLVQTKDFSNRYNSKVKATLLALAKQESYQLYKFNTRQYREVLRSLPIQPHDNIVFSFNSTAEMDRYLGHVHGLKLVLTHNYDIDFFANIRKGLTNPVLKLAMTYTIRHIQYWLTQNQQRYLFVHINESDMAHYAQQFPHMRHATLKAGVDALSLEEASLLRQRLLTTSAPVRLCFTGYLNGQQNLEALQFFAARFWPIMINNYGSVGVKFYVIGSSPSLQVRKLVDHHGWILKADLEDQAFAEAVAACHFSVLPFPFMSGTKLKMLTAIAFGVPFLATQCLGPQAGITPDSCLISDDPASWIQHLDHWSARVCETKTIAELNAYGSNYSWLQTCQQFLAQINPATG